ncbi:MAG: putative Ig domain-containing protein, partial [Lachnospiraceae bacterium]|nr:putative Ig domain-containing protein [Lachnospiraceae bacterium]
MKKKSAIYLVVIIGMLLSIASTQYVMAATQYNTNLVLNGDGSSSFNEGDGTYTNWVADAGSYSYFTIGDYNFCQIPSTKLSPDGGNLIDYYRLDGIAGSNTLYQTIDISGIETDIDNGSVAFSLEGYIRRYCINSTASIILEMYDDKDNLLDTYSLSCNSPDLDDSWQKKRLDNIVSSKTRKMKVSLYADISTQKPGSDYIEFDSISLKLYPVPIMKVKGNNQFIQSGSTTTSTDNNTDFGNVLIGESVTKSFTIENQGAASLDFGTNPVSITGTDKDDFTVSSNLVSSTILPNSSATFDVTFKPTKAGLEEANISIVSNDLNTPYSFNMQGNGLEELKLNTSSPTNGVVDTSYSGYTFTSTGGMGTKIYAVTGGRLPGGMTLSATGVLSGTPDAIGMYTFNVTVTDSTSITNSYTYTMEIEPQLLQINIVTPANGVIGTAYSKTFTSTGGTGAKTYAITGGSLPGGMTLSTAGVLSGTPNVIGTYIFTIRVTDSASPAKTDSHTYTIVIKLQPLEISTKNPAKGTVDAVYNGHTFTSTGGTGAKTYAITGGSLPGGMTLSTAGVLSGTPNAIGTYIFKVTVTDSDTPAVTNSYTYTMEIEPQLLHINIVNPTNGVIGTAYSKTFTSTGGTGPKTYAVTGGSLPGGMTLSTEGVLSGTPNEI